jgi:hypothetical protein
LKDQRRRLIQKSPDLSWATVESVTEEEEEEELKACCVTVESQECFRFCEEEEEEVGCTVDGKMTQKRRKVENGNRRKWLRGVFRVMGRG